MVAGRVVRGVDRPAAHGVATHGVAVREDATRGVADLVAARGADREASVGGDGGGMMTSTSTPGRRSSVPASPPKGLVQRAMPVKTTTEKKTKNSKR